MTLGECLNLIRRVYLNGSRDAMTQVGINVVREIKLHHFPHTPYPREGWIMYTKENRPFLYHSGVKIAVDLKPAQRPVQKQKFALAKGLGSSQLKNSGEELSLSYAQKVLQRKREKYLSLDH